jgi:copper chaperone CopZ
VQEGRRTTEGVVETTRLRIEGASALGGIAAVEEALRTVPGVLRVRADPAAGDEVLVEAADTLDPDALLKAAENAGFIVTIAG